MKQPLVIRLRRALAERDWSFRQVGAFVILLMIVLVFVFFGYSSKDSLGLGVAAEIDGEIISGGQYQKELARLESIYGSIFRGLGTPQQQREFLKRQTIESLVQRYLVQSAAQRNDLLISKGELLRAITQDFAAFQDNGRFSRERYELILTANQWTPAEFETQIKLERLDRLWRGLHRWSLKPTLLENTLEQELRAKAKRFDWIDVGEEAWASQVSVPSAEVAESLKKEDFVKKVQEAFEKKVSELREPEKVRARHILIKTSEKRSEEEARALAQKIKSELKANNFAKLAQQYSEDEGSKAQGGDLGYFSRGMMVPEFEEYVFNAKVGQISEPIATSFGFHIIEVTDRKAAVEPRFEEHRLKLAQALIAKERRQEAVKALEDALKSGDQAQVEKWLKSWGLSFKTSDWTDITQPTVAGLPGGNVDLERVWFLSHEAPCPKQLLRVGQSEFLIRFKEDKIQSNRLEDLAQWRSQTAKYRADDVYNRYIQWLRQRVKIVVSATL